MISNFSIAPNSSLVSNLQCMCVHVSPNGNLLLMPTGEPYRC
jgi:hypothetical protein